MKKYFNEFREFAMRGNVLDLAVGVIIGSAFGKVVSSLVSDVIMPPIGVLIGGVDFTDLSAVIKEASISDTGEVIQAVSLNYGTFIQTIIDFAIVALAIFFMIKAINKLHKKEVAPEAPASPSEEVLLLREIRDSLKK